MINYPFFIGSIVLALLSAWFIYRDAKCRDYNPAIWVVACIFTALTVGVFGTLAVVIAYFLLCPRGKLFICPHCSGKYIYKLAFCPHCGKPVKKECLGCHDLMGLDAKICPHCGLRDI
ncbi:MAG: hypothetical protein GX969_04845 [Firmicutes bacterium]|nr:hypothetical protein [Bacillota bacterium]